MVIPQAPRWQKPYQYDPSQTLGHYILTNRSLYTCVTLGSERCPVCNNHIMLCVCAAAQLFRPMHTDKRQLMQFRSFCVGAGGQQHGTIGPKPCFYAAVELQIFASQPDTLAGCRETWRQWVYCGVLIGYIVIFNIGFNLLLAFLGRESPLLSSFVVLSGTNSFESSWSGMRWAAGPHVLRVHARQARQPTSSPTTVQRRRGKHAAVAGDALEEKRATRSIRHGTFGWRVVMLSSYKPAALGTGHAVLTEDALKEKEAAAKKERKGGIMQ